MKLAIFCGRALVAMAGFTAPASAQTPLRLVPMWIHSSDTDTVFADPGPITVTGTRISVLDGSRQGIVELDGATGRLLRIVGRSGDGPGEYRSITLMAEAPNHAFFAVHDQTRRSVDFLDRDKKPIRRISTGLLYFPKGLVIFDDSTVALSGGRSNGLDPSASVVWISAGGVTENGPQPASQVTDPSTWQKQGRLLLSGGPMVRRGRGVLMADAASGDVWDITASGMRKVATGPGDGAKMAEQFMRPRKVNGQNAYAPWYSFPRAIFIEPMSGNQILEAWSDRDQATLTFYQLAPGHQPRAVITLRMRAGSIARYDAVSFIVSGFGENGDVTVQRIAVPDLK